MALFFELSLVRPDELIDLCSKLPSEEHAQLAHMVSLLKKNI